MAVDQVWATAAWSRAGVLNLRAKRNLEGDVHDRCEEEESDWAQLGQGEHNELCAVRW